MEETFVKLVGDLVANIGVPGALLMVLAYSWIKLQPHVIQFFTSTPQQLERIATSMTSLATKDDLKEVRDEVKEIRDRLIN